MRWRGPTSDWPSGNQYPHPKSQEEIVSDVVHATTAKVVLLYGTSQVDVEVVDLLPILSADALCEWLRKHPEVVVVSRDRHGLYAEEARRGAPEAVQVADRFHLILNLRQAVERALAVQRPHLRVLPPSTPAPRTETAKNPSRQVRVGPRVWKHQAEAAWQGRQEKLALFQTIRRMQATGLKVSQITKHPGVNRRRIDKWVHLDTLPERSRMQPRRGMAESFCDYLRQRWDAGSRHGRTLFVEIQKLGYVGRFSNLAKLRSAWRQPVEEATAVAPEGRQAEGSQLDATPSPAARQISPQVAAALLSEIRAELTLKQGEIVNTLKRQCPGFAAKRELVLGFRTILRVGEVATLQSWMGRAQKTGIHALDRVVRRTLARWKRRL